MSYSEDTVKFIAKNGFDVKLGARPIECFIEREISKILAKEILFGKLENGGNIQLTVINDKLSFNYKDRIENSIMKDIQEILPKVEAVPEKRPKKRASKKVSE